MGKLLYLFVSLLTFCAEAFFLRVVAIKHLFYIILILLLSQWILSRWTSTYTKAFLENIGNINKSLDSVSIMSEKEKLEIDIRTSQTDLTKGSALSKNFSLRNRIFKFTGGSKDKRNSTDDIREYKKVIYANKKNPYWVSLFLLVNILLLICCLDLSFRDLFISGDDLEVAKLGMVNSSHVNIFARLRKEQAAHNLTYVYKAEDEVDWTTTQNYVTALAHNDYTVHATIGPLRSNTAYTAKWKYVSDETNSYLQLETLHFKTFSTGDSSFKFVYSSCVRPNFPYGTKQLKGFQEMSKQNAAFMFFLGDLIYADYPFYLGSDVQTYRGHYRRLFQHPDSRALFSKMPVIFAYDDHEILNDWAGEDQHPYPTAMRAFNEYAGLGNPSSIDDSQGLMQGGSYHTFDYGTCATFFVLDTRRYRSKDPMQKSMLGHHQLYALKAWLFSKRKVPFKFIVSSVPFTLNFPFNGEDTWREFQEERQMILEYIQSNHIQSVIVLSGDRHEVAITRLPGNVLEFSTSPVLQFYSPMDTYEETDNDEKIFTWRTGNVKWASIDIIQDAANNDYTLKYSLFVNDIQGKCFLPANKGYAFIPNSDEPIYELFYKDGRIANQTLLTTSSRI